MSITGFNINGNIEKYDYNSLDNTPDISGGGSGEEWIELLTTVLTEDVAYVELVAPDDKKYKKLHILLGTVGAGLSTASKILVMGSNDNYFSENVHTLAMTNGTVNTWSYPTFTIEKGELFSIGLSCNGGSNGKYINAVYMSGVGNSILPNNGGWRKIRIQPQSADVVFKAGVKIYAWGVYE
jgi:hypothetical protein